MQRVSVIGSDSGAGKTVFAKALAARLGAPYVELDALYWEPGWRAASLDVFRERVTASVAGNAWIVDGNSGKVRDLIWSRADAVVWLDLPLRTVLWRTVWRTVKRSVTREELWSGNRESILNAVLGKNALIPYLIRTYRGRAARFEGDLAQWPHLRLHRFRSSGQADLWLSDVRTA